jgi:predicted membrane protein
MNLSTERLSALSAHRARFGEWRASRPFLGGLLLALGGITVALVVIFSTGITFARASPSALALVAATAVFLCGVFALAKPALAGLLGVAGIVSVVVSLVGTPFGAVLGVLLSILGGNLCYAWQPEAET